MKKLLLPGAIALMFLPALFQPSPVFARVVVKAVNCKHPRAARTGLSDEDVAFIQSRVGRMSLEQLVTSWPPPCILRSDRIDRGVRGETVYAYFSTWRVDRLYHITVNQKGYVTSLQTRYFRPGDLRDADPDPALSTGKRI